MKYLSTLILLFSFFHSHTKANAITEPLEADEGLAIIAIYSQGYAERIKLSGPGLANNHTFGPLNSAQEYKIYKLKAGKYQWSSVVNRIGETMRQNSDLTNNDLSFTITPGKLNYVGLFMYESNGSKYSAKILNRTSIILSILKQDYPELAKKYAIVNGLYPNDPYIEYFVDNHFTQLKD